MAWYNSYSRMQYDVDRLSQQASRIRTISGELVTCKKNLSDGLEGLRNDWQSTAGDKFFAKYETSWIDSIDLYCQMLDQMAQELEFSAAQYQTVTDRFSKISL